MLKLLQKHAKHLQNILLQASFTGLVFLSSMLLAQVLGKASFGTYTWIITLVQLASLFALHGTDDLILRYDPLLPTQGQSRLWRWSLLRIALTSLLLLPLLWAFFRYFQAQIPSQIHIPALGLFPLMALLHFLQTFLRSRQALFLGQIVEKILQPLSFTLSLGLAYLYFPKELEPILWLRWWSFALPLALLWFYTRKLHPKSLDSLPPANPLWPKEGRHFLLNTLLYALATRIDLLLLGLLCQPEELAAYNIGLKLSELALIPLIAVIAFAPTRFSALHAQSLEELQQYYTKITRSSFVWTIAAALGVAIFGPFLLTMYGKDFSESYPYLLALLCARIFHTFFGPVNYLLFLCGESARVARIQGLNLLLATLAHYFAISHFGTWGAVVVAIASLGLLDYQYARLAKQSLGISVYAFSFFKAKA